MRTPTDVPGRSGFPSKPGGRAASGWSALQYRIAIWRARSVTRASVQVPGPLLAPSMRVKRL